MAGSRRLLLLAIFSITILQVTALISTSYGSYNRQICRFTTRKFTICSRDYKCKNGKCIPRRAPPKNPCLFPDATVCQTKQGLLCCAADQKCGKNQCVDKVPEPDTCEFGTTVCNNIDGASCCSNDSQKCVNGICTTNNFCLPETKSCLTSTGLLCCGLDQTCGPDGCIGGNDPDACLPTETLCNNIDGAKCCTADQVCNAGLCSPK